MTTIQRINYIKDWIIKYCKSMKKMPESLVVGVSGGIDSSVVSAICAKTGINTIAVSMPIKENYNNINCHTINLDKIFDEFKHTLNNFSSELSFANSRSRLRMVTLYQIAQSRNALVVGTGNKVEDFGIGFYTKYGDGGVDISPLADCTKTQVWDMGKSLNILSSIINAKPTDGLWDDSRNDEDKLGLTYEQIEEAMNDSGSKYYNKYKSIREVNLHKMKPIPVCKFEKDE